MSKTKIDSYIDSTPSLLSCFERGCVCTCFHLSLETPLSNTIHYEKQQCLHLCLSLWDSVLNPQRAYKECPSSRWMESRCASVTLTGTLFSSWKVLNLFLCHWCKPIKSETGGPICSWKMIWVKQLGLEWWQ